MVVEHGGPPKSSYPKSVFFIISNEFCERFSFYGLRTILLFYFTSILSYSKNEATVLYHIFVMLAYFFPLIGGIISDSFLGKYKTILYLSVVYAIGQLILSASSVPTFNLPVRAASFVGLVLIALGTGGIKPCVSSFGGDQFKLPQQEKYMSGFFSLFYLAINAGSLLSTFITPILQEDVKCYGQETCFPLAFFVPAALMVVSVVIFFAGKSFYKVKEPEGNIFVKVMGCIFHAIGRKIWSKEKCEHWLDYAEDKYERSFLEDVKSVLQVLKLFIPLPIFWALYDQQGSRWTFQALNMNGNVFGYHIKPEQFLIVNPLFILLLTPLFKVAIYPVVEKFFFINTALRKLTVGGFLTALSFVISAIVELQIEPSYVVQPESGLAQVRIFNSLDCKVDMLVGDNQFVLESLGMYENLSVPLDINITVPYTATFKDCPSAPKNPSPGSISIHEGSANTYVLLPTGDMYTRFDDVFEKSATGLPRVRAAVYSEKDVVLELKGSGGEKFDVPKTYNITDFKNIGHGTYEILLDGQSVLKDITMENAAMFTIVGNSVGGKPVLKAVQVAKPNTVHMLWQLPQYIVITSGEIMFSITGLEFAFTQAPSTMKALLTSCWLLTVAFGNLIVAVIAEAHFFKRQIFEFLLFAILMFLDMIIFAVMATFYKYVNVSSSNDNSSSDDVDMKSRKGMYNDTYPDDY